MVVFLKTHLALFDLYSMNHDANTRDSPCVFAPSVFYRKVSMFDYVLQGVGKCISGHRCAGEKITHCYYERIGAFLVGKTTYDLPGNDRLNRIPCIPQSKMITEKNPRSNWKTAKS